MTTQPFIRTGGSLVDSCSFPPVLLIDQV